MKRLRWWLEDKMQGIWLLSQRMQITKVIMQEIDAHCPTLKHDHVLNQRVFNCVFNGLTRAVCSNKHVKKAA